MGSPLETLTTENVVASTGIDQELDLQSMARDLDGAQYDPDRFPGLVYQMKDPKATALLFRSGKLIITGATSVEDIDTALNRLFDRLRDLGVALPETLEYTIQNMVITGELNQELNLTAIAVGLGFEAVEYEPEQFPGLVYRVDDLGTVALLFGSGNLVITGGTHPEDAEETMTFLIDQLEDLDLLERT